MIDLIYVIAQIIGFFAFAITLFAYHRKDKKTILGNMIISNILNLSHYLLLGAFSGCVTKLLAIFRNYFIILKEKYPKLSNVIYLMVCYPSLMFLTFLYEYIDLSIAPHM